MQAFAVSICVCFLSMVSGEGGSPSHATTPAGSGDAAGAHSSEGAGEHEELHAANAVLFLFTALVFGIVLRRSMSHFIIPYTGMLVVR
jgi:hypothetical protein